MYILKLETVQEMILTFLWSMRTVKFKNGWGVVDLDERGEAGLPRKCLLQPICHPDAIHLLLTHIVGNIVVVISSIQSSVMKIFDKNI